MFYSRLEKAIIDQHLKDHESSYIIELEKCADEETLSNVVDIKKNSPNMVMVGVPFPSEKRWESLFERAERIAPGSRAYHIALAEWLNAKEGNSDDERELNSLKAYKTLREAIDNHGEDSVLISCVVRSMFNCYPKCYSDQTFINDLLQYTREYFELKKTDWGDLYEISEILGDLDIYLERSNRPEIRKKILQLDLVIREEMLKMQPEDAMNLCSLAFDSKFLGNKLKQTFYTSMARRIAREGRLSDIGFFGDITYVKQTELEERLRDFLGEHI